MNNSFSHLSSEEQLLLSMARLKFSGAQREQIRRLAERITDWDYFVSLANAHGLIALYHNNISITGIIGIVPAKVADTFRSAYLRSLSQNTRLHRLLEEILSISTLENIRVILLKGAVLEKIVYGNTGLRQMSDIDLLVKDDEALPLRNLLLKNGFESLPLISPLHEKLLPCLKSHLPVMHKSGISAEIHVRLFDRNNEPLICEIINNPDVIADSTPEILAPPLQLHFLYLVKHLDKHARTKDLQLKLYADLVALLTEYPDQLLNANLLSLAEKAGLINPMAEILLLMERFWNIRFPAMIKDLISNVNSEKITEKFIYFLRHPSSYPRHEEKFTLLRPLYDIPGVAGKIRFIAGYLFPSLSFLRYKFRLNHKSTALFYYPAWWWRSLKIAQGKLIS